MALTEEQFSKFQSDLDAAFGTQSTAPPMTPQTVESAPIQQPITPNVSQDFSIQGLTPKMKAITQGFEVDTSQPDIEFLERLGTSLGKAETKELAQETGLPQESLVTGSPELKEKIAETAEAAPSPTVGGFVEEKVPFVGTGIRAAKRAGERIEEQVGRVGEEAQQEAVEEGRLEEGPTISDVAKGAVKSIIPVLGESGRAIGETIIGGIFDTIQALTPKPVEEFVSDTAKDAFESVAKTAIGKQGLQALASGVESYGEFKEENPNIAAQIEGVFGITEAFIVPVVGKKVAGVAAEKARETGIKSLESVEEFIKQRGEIKQAVVDREIDKIGQEIFQPSPAIATRDPRLLEGIKETARVITKAKNFDELTNQLKNTKSNLGKEIGSIIEPKKDVKINLNTLTDPIEQKLRLLSDDAQTAEIAEEMTKIWEKELINLKALGNELTVEQAQARKVRLNDLLSKFFKKPESEMTDLEISKLQGLNEIRRGYMQSIAQQVPEVAAKNELFGDLSVTIPLSQRAAIKSGNVLTARGLSGFIQTLPGIRFIRSIVAGRVPVDEALLSRARSIEEELGKLTKTLEKLQKKSKKGIPETILQELKPQAVGELQKPQQ